MMMSVRAVRVPVLDFFSGRWFHVDHLQREGDVLARQRVVAVEDDGVALDLHHGEDLAVALGVGAFDLATHLHAGRKVLLRDLRHQRLVAVTESQAALTREKFDGLKDAPGFDKDNWPDMADNRWSNDIHSYYRTKSYEQTQRNFE